jgi:hypothetical protein
MINEPDWIGKAIAVGSGFFGAVFGVTLGLVKNERRLSTMRSDINNKADVASVAKIEVDISSIKQTVEKSSEHGERMARIESTMGSLETIIARMDGKLDRLRER